MDHHDDPVSSRTSWSEEESRQNLSCLAGLCGLLGIVWLLASMFLVGAGVLLSVAARDLTERSRLVSQGAGIATWLCGFVLIGLYLTALIKQRYPAATLAAVTPLIGATVLYFGPTSPADFWGVFPPGESPRWLRRWSWWQPLSWRY